MIKLIATDLDGTLLREDKSFNKEFYDIFYKLKEKNIKFFLDLEIHEYRIDDKISYDKEFLIQDPDGYLLRFNN